MNRRAKIVCTIGPASAERGVLFSLIKGGMDVARLNLSHGDHAFHRRAVALIKEGAERFKRPVAILSDLQGIKIRVGPIKGGAVRLKKGKEVLLRPGRGEGREGDEGNLFLSYPGLIKDSKAGGRILLDDGLIELRVVRKEGAGLRARVFEGGLLSGRKGVNLPGMKINMPSFTEKDKEDLAFSLDSGADYVAVSFVREAGDLRKVRRWLKKRGRSVPLIAKIEKPEAIKNIEEIIEEAEGIMVARGDLGVELPPEEVPLLQKMLIERANMKGKLVITATQMLESMTGHLRPTRAEATDVANAVLDGTDALMLSAETSAGSYPVEALSMMDRIIRKTESGIAGCGPHCSAIHPAHPGFTHIREGSFSEAVAEAAAMTAVDIGARYIVAFTQSGYTARLVSKFRPEVPIVAFTPSEEIRRRMSLYWGVTPLLMSALSSTDSVFEEVEKTLLRKKMIKSGERVVITASTPILGEGKTNLLKLHRIS